MASAVDSWESLHETCQRLELEVTSSLSSNRGNSVHSQAQWREKVQEALGRFTLAVLSLRQKLNTGSANLTQGEKRRREGIVSSLEGREKQFRLVYQQQQSGGSKKRGENDQRRRLLDSAIVDVGTDDSWTNREDEPLLRGEDKDLMTSYHQRKQETLADQDRSLDALHDVIIRGRHLAENIQSEATAHNDLIDDIDQGLERTTQRITSTTQDVRRFGERDSVWRYWLVIFLLTIVIIVIIAIPGKK